MVEALVKRKTQVTVVARSRDRLPEIERRLGVSVVRGDASDATLARAVLGDVKPGAIVLTAGPGPIVAMNRALAIAELRGLGAGFRRPRSSSSRNAEEKKNMRKLNASTLVSLDGVIGDPQVWAMEYFDAEAQEDALQRLLACDAMLMGRHTYEIFARLWPARRCWRRSGWRRCRPRRWRFRSSCCYSYWPMGGCCWGGG